MAGRLWGLKGKSETRDLADKMLIMVKRMLKMLPERIDISEGQGLYRMLSFHERRVAEKATQRWFEISCYSLELRGKEIGCLYFLW